MKIDLQAFADIIDEIQLDPLVLQQGLINAANYVRDVWRSAVSGNKLPGMTKAVFDDKYAASLSTGQSINLPSAYHAIVTPYNYADGADKWENGTEAYDMKPSLLSGPKARITKDGKAKYNIIPFRHYTPINSASGSTAISINMQMPKDVYSAAKKLNRSVFNPETGKVNWNQSLDWNAPPATNFMGYTHQSSVYQGMYRVGDPRHTQYLTFRTVSTPRIGKDGKRKGSDPRSWWHPTIEPNPIIQAVFDYTMPQVEENIIALIKGT